MPSTPGKKAAYQQGKRRGDHNHEPSFEPEHLQAGCHVPEISARASMDETARCVDMTERPFDFDAYKEAEKRYGI